MGDHQEQPHVTVRRMVFPTDFSQASGYALAHARWLQSVTKAHLHLLHVFDATIAELPSPYLFLPGGDHWIKDRLEGFNAQAESSLKSLAETFPHRCDVVVRQGRPAPEIVRYAEACQCDLIVMGTHGFTGLDRLVLGSVAEYVVRHAPCPVLSVKPPDHLIGKDQ